MRSSLLATILWTKVTAVVRACTVSMWGKTALNQNETSGARCPHGRSHKNMNNARANDRTCSCCYLATRAGGSPWVLSCHLGFVGRHNLRGRFLELPDAFPTHTLARGEGLSFVHGGRIKQRLEFARSREESWKTT